MSHPERLSPAGGGSASTASKPPGINGNGDGQSGQSGLSLAEFAKGRGLSQSAARPPVRQYIAQLWQRRHFMWTFASSKSISMYTTARLGQLWQVLTPLLNAAVYYLIFGVLLDTSRGIPDFIPFLVTGVFVFTFTQSSVMAGVRAISGNLGLVRALHFPRAALPISFALQQLQQLLFSMLVLFLIAIGFGSYPKLSWLLIIPALAMQFVFNTGMAMIMARLGSKTPDLAQLMPFIMRTWMYASGVMFSIPMMLKDKPAWIADVLQWNPAAVYMDLIRFALIDGYGSENLPPHIWAFALGWAILFGIAGFVYFWKAEERYGRG
jgi:teichoic acid transport system permease protein